MSYTLPYTDTFRTPEEQGNSAMIDLLNTVYHLQGAMYFGVDVGFGADMQTFADAGATQRQEFRFGSLNGYETQTYSYGVDGNGVPNLKTYPCDKSISIPPVFIPSNESPNPFPNKPMLYQAGTPIYLKVDSGNDLKVNVATSSIQQNGVAVPIQVLSISNDQNLDPNSGKPYIGKNEAFVIPVSPLAASTNYQVTLNGTINGTAFTRSFTMTTGL